GQNAMRHEARNLIHAVEIFCDPVEGLQVTQTPLAVFYIRLQHIAGIADAAMPFVALGELRFHETDRVFALNFRTVTALQILVERAIAPDEPRFEEIGANGPVGLGLTDAVLDRTGRVADLEAEVPQKIKNGFDRLFAR